MENSYVERKLILVDENDHKRLYRLIVFDERVIFWFQLAWPLPCACAYVALPALRLAYNHYTSSHTNNATKAHADVRDEG